jgi:hypothetical protein
MRFLNHHDAAHAMCFGSGSIVQSTLPTNAGVESVILCNTAKRVMTRYTKKTDASSLVFVQPDYLC